ncbi:MAG: DUF1836 domain-containing protein [Ruminococcaceae bacterium]|nr:DUF1836 domain-containing protein [Oscillospiraceae bacterium]
MEFRFVASIGIREGAFGMDIAEMERLVREATQDADLHPSEIPSIDLYLDQITSLVLEKKREASKHFEDRVLTKTMINNYSKDGLLSPIKGKKYSKEHILQMLLVYEMKNTLSIGEIKRILQNLYGHEAYDSRMLEEIYSNYLSLKELERVNAWDQIKRFAEDARLNVEDEGDFLTLLLGLCAMSSYLKNTVQLLLSAHYPELIDEKVREEQEKEEVKRQKAEQKAEAKRQKNTKETKEKKDDKKGKEKNADVSSEEGDA